MPDIIAPAPFSIRRRSNLPRLTAPRIRVGTALGAIAGLLGHAFSLAYVAPYASLGRKPPVIPDHDLEGRDPNW